MSFSLDFTPYPGPEGPLSYAEVPWDTELYGIPFYELRCDGAAEAVGDELPRWLETIRARTEGHPTFLFTRILPSNLALCEALCRHGFYPAELTLRISMPLGRFTRMHPNAGQRARLRRATAADVAELSALAGEAFVADRFHLDPHLPKDLSDRRYAQWVERGFRDGDDLYVYEQTADVPEDHKMVGFYLIRGTPDGEVDLSLAGVGARYRRTGIGALMYEEMLAVCRELGYRVAVTSISANNLDVANLFMRLGFSVRRADLTLHQLLSPSHTGDD